MTPTLSNGVKATTLAVRIDAVKAYSKNTLVAFLDFTLLDIGLSIKGATVHEKEGSRWVGMPARSYSDAEGAHWAPIIEFASKEARYRINDAVLAAYDLHSAGGAGR
jgi:DNA-binding cell septation regulator SpoVG